MEDIEYFDYLKVAQEMEIPVGILDEIEKEVKEEFPNDKMMFELHVLRVIKSRYWERLVHQEEEKMEKQITSR